MRYLCFLVFFSVLFSPSLALALTCDDCLKMQAEISSLEGEAKELETQFDALYKKREFPKLTPLQTRQNAINKRLLELKKNEPQCKDLCKPDARKMADCRKILSEIVQKEADSPSSGVDGLYKNLANCYNEYRELVGKKDQ